MIKIINFFVYLLLFLELIPINNTEINVKYNFNLHLKLKKNFTRSIEQHLSYNRSLHLR